MSDHLALRVLHAIEASDSAAIRDRPEQSYANLLGHAARGEVLRMNERTESRQAQVVESVVTTGKCCFRREALAPQVAAHMPANLRFCCTLNLFDDGQPAIADGCVASLEGECP